jgi:S1-C subfamily serine protease
MKRASVSVLTAALLVGGLVACSDDNDDNDDNGGGGAGATTTSAPATTAPPATTSTTAEADEGGSTATPAAGGYADLGVVPEVYRNTVASVVTVFTERGLGTGVIWSRDGLIVTNDHVVADGQRIEVAFADGRRLPGTLVGSDPLLDLAVVKTERTDLPVPQYDMALPDVGELAIAIGNPLGFEGSVTAGIISGLHRSIPGASAETAALVDLIQTDAAISPGNSGGALVDGAGRVIGINVAYLPPQGGAVSIGFAIPSATVGAYVPELAQGRTPAHAYLGLQPVTLDADTASRFDLPVDEGVLAVAVPPGGPAATAGIRPGDVVVGIDGRPLRASEELIATLRQHKPGDVVRLTVRRPEGEQEVSVTLAARPR